MTDIPEEIFDSLQRYVDHGIPPGGFLRAVLENNLSGAAMRADQKNHAIFWDITNYIYWQTPGDCHGSADIVEAWIAKRKAERLARTGDGATAEGRM